MEKAFIGIYNNASFFAESSSHPRFIGAPDAAGLKREKGDFRSS
jgi:hypothetical protein